MTDRVELMIDYGMRLVGTPYIWGGNNPLVGLDCSGLVLELLRGVGLWGDGDTSAQGLYKWLRSQGRPSAPKQRGALAFFGTSREGITHVALCVTDELMLEAGGGGSATKTVEDAAKIGAFVRLRPIKRRRDLVDCVVP